MFFSAPNLTTQTLLPCPAPWEFSPTEKLTVALRGDKEIRQAFYQNPNTQHCFYTGLEAVAASQRISRENPPRYLHAFVADYDIPIPDSRITEVIADWKYKPAWIENSLGGNRRIVWLLPRPILLDDYDLAVFVLQSAIVWLRLGLLPGLDDAAFIAPSRLYCNGCAWKPTGHGAVSQSELQAFFVKCGRKFRFKAPESENIPLDLAEAEIKSKYPNFTWPSDFSLETQGPSFWIPESVSPMSAIVKPGGMFTFSAHAAKPFYSWADILGAEFVSTHANDSITKATSDIWWDGKRFARKINGSYCSLEKGELLTYFKVDCRLGFKPGDDGIPPVEKALAHIHNHQRVTAAIPFVFRPPGLIIFQGKRVLNTYSGKPVEPAACGTWGDSGDFPFLSTVHFPRFFDPIEQLPLFLAWWKHYYESAINYAPYPGQNIFLMGGTGIGKTWTNRDLVGRSVGGYADASDFLVRGEQFNSHLMECPHWCLDDDSPNGSPQAQARMQSVMKKTIANQQFLTNKKFEVSGMTEWMGRIGITTNLDYLSSRIVGSLDNNSLDKTNLFRCATKEVVFPTRPELSLIVDNELPHFLRWLLDWSVPDTVVRDSRYGFRSYQEPSLLDRTHQSGPTTPFKEVLIESLATWFSQHPEENTWAGTVNQLIKLLMCDPLNDYVLRSVKLEQVSRHLEAIQREGLIRCEVETGLLKTRIWRFYRDNEKAK